MNKKEIFRSLIGISLLSWFVSIAYLFLYSNLTQFNKVLCFDVFSLKIDGIKPPLIRLSVWLLPVLVSIWKYDTVTRFVRRLKNTLLTRNYNAVHSFLLFVSLFIIISWIINKATLQDSKLFHYLFYFIFSSTFVSIVLEGLFNSLETEISVRPTIEGIEPDVPIKTSEEDLLNREKFVAELCQEIEKYKYEDSLVLGLLGEWGEGKTSVLNLVGERLKRNKDIILVKFDPWYFNKQETLLEKFYETIYKTINKEHFFPNLSKYFKRYQKMLTPLTKKLEIDLDIFSDAKSIESTQGKLNKILRKLDKKVVIFIDNVDRLDKNEIKLILKLVILCTNFYKFLYIITLDKERVAKVLNGENLYDKDILEKIIQQEIKLPKVEQKVLDSQIDLRFDRLFKGLDILQNERDYTEFAKQFSQIYRSDITRLIKNIRMIKRLVNDLYLSLPLVKGEVNYFDFVVLQIIKIHFPKMYEDIYQNREYYYFWDWTFDTRNLFLTGRDRQDKINKYLEDLLAKFPDNRETLKNLLAAIFPYVKNYVTNSNTTYDAQSSFYYETGKRISHPRYFEKYFLLTVPRTEIPDVQVDLFIDGINQSQNFEEVLEKFTVAINEFKKDNKLVDFINKLILSEVKINDSIKKYLIKSIYHNSPFFSTERHFFLDSEFKRSIDLVFALARHTEATKEIQEVLLDTVRNSQSDFFAVSVVLFSTREHNQIITNFDNINFPELQKEIINRLKEKYISSNQNIFELEPVHYLRVLNYWAGFGEEEQKLVNKYILRAFQLERTRIGVFLKNYLREEPFKRYEGIKKLDYKDLASFLDVDELYLIISATEQEKLYSSDEEKVAVEEFIKIYEEKKPGIRDVVGNIMSSQPVKREIAYRALDQLWRLGQKPPQKIFERLSELILDGGTRDEEKGKITLFLKNFKYYESKTNILNFWLENTDNSMPKFTKELIDYLSHEISSLDNALDILFEFRSKNDFKDVLIDSLFAIIRNQVLYLQTGYISDQQFSRIRSLLEDYKDIDSAKKYLEEIDNAIGSTPPQKKAKDS